MDLVQPDLDVPLDLAGRFEQGRLIALPRKTGPRERILAFLADALFSVGRVYHEREVDAQLDRVHDDRSMLRRHLVTSGHLLRTRDGSRYWRPDDREAVGRDRT